MFVYSLWNRTALSIFRGPNTYYTDSWLHGVAQTGNTSHSHAIYFSNWFKDEERYNYESPAILWLRSIWLHHAHLYNPCVKRVALRGNVSTLFKFYWQRWNKAFLITQVKKNLAGSVSSSDLADKSQSAGFNFYPTSYYCFGAIGASYAKLAY